jgi:N-acetylneuraminic acid mutarotase
MGYLSTVEEYDPATDTWTRKADMPTARAALATVVVNDRIYAIGGSDREISEESYSTLSVVEEYDPATDIWIKKTDMPTARGGLSAISLNGKVYAIGGCIMNTSYPLMIVEEYDPVTDQWKKETSMPTPRSGLFTGVVDGVAYATGGHMGDGFCSILEEYTSNPTREVMETKSSKTE